MLAYTIGRFFAWESVFTWRALQLPEQEPSGTSAVAAWDPSSIVLGHDQPKASKPKNLPTINRAAIRIAALSIFKEESTAEDSAKKILTEIGNWQLGLPATVLSGTSWQKQWHGARPAFVGVCKLSESYIDLLLPESGRRGIFFNKIDTANAHP
eukprot:s10_g43.t1